MSKDTDKILDVVYINIKEAYSKEEADAFISNKELSGIETCGNEIQRGLANRVLISKLLAFRAKSDVKVVDVIFCLIPDGDNESWLRVFKLVILPFLKENNVKL